jgi:hypothetical protein
MDDDVAESFLLLTCEQAREDGVGVEAGKAPPDDAAVGVDEGSHAPVANRGKLEVVGGRSAFRSSHFPAL